MKYDFMFEVHMARMRDGDNGETAVVYSSIKFFIDKPEYISEKPDSKCLYHCNFMSLIFK
jgi:hypothetical protein